MLGLGVSAADLSVVLGQAFVGGMMLALPFAAFVAAGQSGGGAASRRRRRARARARHAAGAEHRTAHAHAGGDRGPESRTDVPHERRGRVMEAPGSDAFHAAQLRRAAPIVRLFAGASCEGEKEAAYQALVRLAAAVNTARGASYAGAPVTPVVLYRDLTRAGAGTASGASVPEVAFDARTCAELERREPERREPERREPERREPERREPERREPERREPERRGAQDQETAPHRPAPRVIVPGDAATRRPAPSGKAGVSPEGSRSTERRMAFGLRGRGPFGPWRDGLVSGAAPAR